MFRQSVTVKIDSLPVAVCCTSQSLQMGNWGDGTQAGCRRQGESLGSSGANGELARQEQSSHAEGLATADTSQLFCFITCSKEI